MYLHTGLGQDVAIDPVVDWGAMTSALDVQQTEIINPPLTDWGAASGGITIFQSDSQGNPLSSPTDTSNWWSTLTGALVPISQAAANVIHAVQGTTIPVGYTRNAAGQLVPIPTGYTRNAAGQLVPISGYSAFSSLPTWALPAGLALGAFLLFKKKKT